MPNLKYLNINGTRYYLGRDTMIFYGTTSDTFENLQEGDFLINSSTSDLYRYNGTAWVLLTQNNTLINLTDGSANASLRGSNTKVENSSYIMGQNAIALGNDTQSSGSNSLSSGLGTIAQRRSQVVFGEYNTLDTLNTTVDKGNYILILGNGTSDSSRSNATTIDWEGSINTQGSIIAGTVDDDYGLNDQALLSSNTINLWEDIMYE